jgi:hypothetical protein
MIDIFLQSDFNDVMLDMIASDSTIRPIIAKKAAAKSDRFTDLRISKKVEIKFFGSGVNTQIIYINDAGDMLLSEVRGKASYRLRKTDKEKIIADFPEWSEKIERIGEYAGLGGKKKRK